MKYLWVVACLMVVIAVPVSASEYTAPQVPESGRYIMPETRSFSEGILQMLRKALSAVAPDIHNAMRTGGAILATVILLGILQLFQDGARGIYDLAGTAAISSFVLLSTKSMVQLGMDTVVEISEYGKLLLPVMTGALAAQGGITTSAALYAGTAMFNALVNTALTDILCPMIWFYIALSIGSAATGEGILKNLRDLIKSLASWSMKTVLTVFTTYMGITGVISGTTDAAALKATKVVISSAVPVVGSILSDASEAILVSAETAKNAAGIYGIFAVLSVFLVPFLRIATHYLVLKGTFVLSSIVGSKTLTQLIADVSTAMGLLLAMTGSACLLQLISTVCFLKGVG